MKKILILTSLSLAVGLQANIAYVGGSYLQNFDGLPVVDSTTRVTLTGTGVVGAQVAIPGVDGWQAARLGGSGTGNIAIWEDSPNAGGRFHAYGIGSNRSLGSLSSGTTIGGFGASFVNDSTETFNQVNISFVRQIWHVQGTTNPTEQYENRLDFAYGTSAAGITSSDFLTSLAMVELPALSAISPAENTINAVASSTDPNRRVNGTLPEWSELIQASIVGVNWAPGDVLFIRWSDFDASGFDAGISIDNFSMTAVVPEPSTYALLSGLLVLGLVWMRRRKA